MKKRKTGIFFFSFDAVPGKSLHDYVLVIAGGLAFEISGVRRPPQGIDAGSALRTGWPLRELGERSLTERFSKRDLCSGRDGD